MGRLRGRITRLEEARRLKGGQRTLTERFLRSAERLRAIYRSEPLPPEHPDGDYFAVWSMQRCSREEE
jgi:hypothetical protein